ncbi:MAG: hypothetical protein QM656_06040 [Paracoccaceae bacterium]
MPLTGNELTDLANLAHEASEALEKAGTHARAQGKIEAANDLEMAQFWLDSRMQVVWNANRQMLLDPKETRPVIAELRENIADIQAATTNLGAVAKALRAINRVLDAITKLHGVLALV